jgi:hypothetical protein
MATVRRTGGAAVGRARDGAAGRARDGAAAIMALAACAACTAFAATACRSPSRPLEVTVESGAPVADATSMSAPSPSPSPSAPSPSPSPSPPRSLDAYQARLHAAGDAARCDAEIERVARDLAADRRFSDADLTRERALRDTTNTGSMPYPSPGTACSLFGIQKALQQAIDQRGKR